MLEDDALLHNRERRRPAPKHEQTEDRPADVVADAALPARRDAHDELPDEDSARRDEPTGGGAVPRDEEARQERRDGVEELERRDEGGESSFGRAEGLLDRSEGVSRVVPVCARVSPCERAGGRRA